MALLGASVAIALAVLAPAPIEIEWNAPPECPAPAELRASVVQLLGGERTREPVRAEATVVREGEGYAAQLVLAVGEQRSERRLEASGCAALADAVAVVVAVTVDPVQLLDEEREHVEVPEAEPIAEPIAAPIVAPIDVPEIPSAVVSAPTVERARVRAPGVHVRVFGGPDYGATPKITGAIGGAIGLRGRWWRAELDGSFAFARTTSLTMPEDFTAKISRWSIGARGCGVPTRGRIEVPLCAAIEAGQIVGSGTGETIHPQTERRPWIAAVVGPALAISVVPRLAILVGADLVVPLWRARFVIGAKQIHEPRPIGVRGLVGVELRLGGRP